MESTRSLSPLELGGWSLGTERSSTPPASQDLLQGFFKRRLEDLDQAKEATDPGRSPKEGKSHSDPGKGAEEGSDSNREVANSRRELHKKRRSATSDQGLAQQNFQNASEAADSGLEVGSESLTNVAPPVSIPPLDGALSPAHSVTPHPGAGSNALATQSGPVELTIAAPIELKVPLTPAPAQAATATTHRNVQALGSVQNQAPTGRPGTGAGQAQAASAPPPPLADAEAERVASILRQIRLQLTPGMRQVTMQLVPAELGRLTVKLTIRSGRLSGVVRADSKQTLEMLEQHAPELRAALGREGFEAPDLKFDFEQSAADDGRSQFASQTKIHPPLSEVGSRSQEESVLPGPAAPRLADGTFDTYA